MTMLIGADFRRLFTTFEHTAYRLEVRERYGLGYEAEPVRQFLAGVQVQVDLSYMSEWLRLMTDLTDGGKRVERVRVVSKPYSDYTRYGLWLSPNNLRAGEDIRYLTRGEGPELPDHDYWLFDSSRLYVLRFDEADDLLGAELIEDPATVVQHCYWRDAAWHYAIRHAEYMRVNEGAVEHPAGA